MRQDEFLAMLAQELRVSLAAIRAAVQVLHVEVITGLRILTADHNPHSADLLAMFLEMMGNEVRTAYDGVAQLRRTSGSEQTRCCSISACHGWTARTPVAGFGPLHGAGTQY